MDELRRVAEFRNRLVAFMNLARQHAGRYGQPPTDAVREHLSTEQPWLAQEYGRLFKVVNRWGEMMMSSPALGITSRDVIQDAIHDVGDVYYGDICRLAVQHLDTVIGRLQADVEERGVQPEMIYRLTSPVFWLQRLASLLRWLWGTSRRRIATVVGAVVLAIIGGIVSGWAQAFFT